MKRLTLVVRLLPAVLAAFELRSLLVSAFGGGSGVQHHLGTSDFHSFGPWLLALLLAGTGLIMREAGRGLGGRLPRPRWSAAVLRAWALSFAALVAIFLCEGLFHGLSAAGHPLTVAHVLGPDGWSSTPVALGVGFLVAISLHSGRRALRLVARWHVRSPRSGAGADPPVVRRGRVFTPSLALAAHSWSSRGPPARLTVAVTA